MSFELFGLLIFFFSGIFRSFGSCDVIGIVVFMECFLGVSVEWVLWWGVFILFIIFLRVRLYCYVRYFENKKVNI